jgi:hypothetical protein
VLKKASYKKQLKGGDNKKRPKARENELHSPFLSPLYHKRSLMVRAFLFLSD